MNRTILRVATVLAVAAMAALSASPVSARPTGSVDECVQRETDKGASTAEAIAKCRASEDGGGGGDDGGGGLQQERDSSDDGGGVAVPLVVVLVVLALGGGFGLGWLLLGRRAGGAAAAGPAASTRATPATGAPAPPGGAAPTGVAPAGGPPPSVDPAPAAKQRRQLVVELIDLRDRVTSDAMRAQIGSALASVGVTEIVLARGAPFDAQRARGVDGEDTDDVNLVGTVASTERPGYADGGVVIRQPDVVVFRARS